MQKLRFIALILLLSACVHKKTIDYADDKKFEVFKESFVEKLWKLNPTSALYNGYHKYDSILIPVSSEFISMQNSEYKKIHEQLGNYNLDQLSPVNKTDYQMIKNYLESSMWYNDVFRSYEWNPSEYNLGGEFAQIISENYDKLDNRLRNVSKRLDQVVNYYAAAQKMIKVPTMEHTELAIQQNRGAISVFQSMLRDSLKKSGLSEEEKIAVSVKADAATNAILKYVEWLEKDILPGLKSGKAKSFRIGEELYAQKFQYDIVSGYSAKQIYEKALNRRNELHAEMEKISKQLWPKYFGKNPMPSDKVLLIKRMIDTLAGQHVHRDSLIPAIKKQMPELVNFINKKDLIYLDPKKPLVVRETPGYMQGVAGASISAPGPYEKSANTYYNVTPLTNYSPEQAESYLREYNFYILQILNIHEAIPGHYTQLVYSNQSPSIIKSILGNGAMVEGWAVYTERMMLEEGYPSVGSGQAPSEMWLMYYKWHMRVVCNTILDYSVHVLNMSKEEGLKLLMENAFQERAEAEGKWRRVTLTQVQLCSYFTGFSEIYDFREELKREMGTEFNLKKFHEKFLSYGSAPVKYIKEIMQEELKKED